MKKDEQTVMDIELFLILSASYEYTAEPMPGENAEGSRLRRYIKGGIESYLKKRNYLYDATTHEWRADTSETARRRSQGAKDGWEIRRAKLHKQ